MDLERLVLDASQRGASDLHLEPGMPPTLRVRGELEAAGPAVSAEEVRGMARALLEGGDWERFERRRSADLGRKIGRLRCRINVMHTSGGIGMAIRLLTATTPTLDRLNLHPSLAELVRHAHGLVLVCGPTGSGKSTTLAALLHEVNVREACHIVTLEQPIEFRLRPRRALIRQREVGLDTPSFRRGLLDALREDPDVVMVGELREPATMRLALSAAETGHLVLSTLHSSTCAEALHRLVSAFPSRVQPMVCAQLADSLRGIVCQRLVYRPESEIRVPECEVMVASTPARSLIRQGHFFKLQTILETGARDGQMTWERYGAWLGSRSRFFVPSDEALAASEADTDDLAAPARPVAELAPSPRRRQTAKPMPSAPPREAARGGERDGAADDVIVIPPPTGSIADILEELK